MKDKQKFEAFKRQLVDENEKKYGKGTIVFLSCPIEVEEYIIYQRIVRNLIDKYVCLDKLTVKTNSPTDVETVTFKDGDNYYINNALLLDPKNKPFMPSFDVSVKTGKAPAAVKLLPDETNLEFSFDGEYTSFKTRETRSEDGA